jgi:hypothetical protein
MYQEMDFEATFLWIVVASNRRGEGEPNLKKVMKCGVVGRRGTSKHAGGTWRQDCCSILFSPVLGVWYCKVNSTPFLVITLGRPLSFLSFNRLRDTGKYFIDTGVVDVIDNVDPTNAAKATRP